MSDLLNIGVSALLSYRSALNTVSQNIANANTTGYSRQRVDLQAANPTYAGNGYTGGGVQVASTTRLSDSLINTRLAEDNASYARLNTFQQLASRVDTLMSGTDTGLSTPLQNFMTAAGGVASNPSSTASRQALLSAVDGLAGRFNDLQSQLQGMESDINGALSQSVTLVNQYSSAIAQLNDRIAAASGASNGNPPNDLLDQRDQLINQLSQQIGVSTVTQTDGSINVFASGGQALVLGNNAQTLALTDDAYRSGRQELVLGSSKININSQVSGGAIGGLLDARSQLLDPAENKLGRLAVGLTNAVNAINANGVDQSGALGQNLLVPLSGTALRATANSGSAQVGVGFSNAGQLTGDDYKLSYTGSAWQLTQTSTGAAVTMSGTGTASDPLVGAGLSLTISGSPAAGDSYLIQPTRNAAAQVQLATSDPTRIAAASPVTTGASLTNSGSGAIGAGSVLDAGNAGLQTAVTIQFTSASTYSINGSGSYSYSAGSNIDYNGWRVQISGTPSAGDSFTVKPTGANSGNNSNALALSGLSSSGVLDGGRTSLTAGNAALVAQTGGIAQQAALRRDAQQAIQQNTQTERDTVSGVNLDEEAADLVRYQQAYQAAARVISVADTVFQTLLQAAKGQ